MIKTKSILLLFLGIIIFSCRVKQQGLITEKESTTEYHKDSFVQKMEEIINGEGVDEAMIWFEANKKSPIYSTDEVRINQLGYKLLYDYKSIKEAIKIFEFNATLFPESGNVFDSLAEAYLKNGDYNLSVENYTKSSNLSKKKYFHHLGFLTPKKYVATEIPEKISDLFIAEGDWDNDIAFVYLQGGPDFELNINEKDGLHLMENEQNILKIYPLQSPMLNPNIFIASPTLTYEQSAFENAQSVEILHKTVSYLKEKGKKVYIIGHSYGASICLEYLNSKEILAEKVVIMGMDLDEDISSWEQLKPGEFIRWENGVKPVKRTLFGWVPQGYPKKKSFDRVVDNLEMIIRVNMAKKYSALLKPEKIIKVISIYATKDEANGVKSKHEIEFLEKHGAIVHKIDGDHHSMLTKGFMTKLYEHLINGTSL